MPEQPRIFLLLAIPLFSMVLLFLCFRADVDKSLYINNHSAELPVRRITVGVGPHCSSSLLLWRVAASPILAL